MVRKERGHNTATQKDLRVTGCGICKRYIYSNQNYVWTRRMGYVHTEECLGKISQ